MKLNTTEEKLSPFYMAHTIYGNLPIQIREWEMSTEQCWGPSKQGEAVATEPWQWGGGGFNQLPVQNLS
jgi:hypothetical protein